MCAYLGYTLGGIEPTSAEFGQNGVVIRHTADVEPGQVLYRKVTKGASRVYLETAELYEELLHDKLNLGDRQIAYGAGTKRNMLTPHLGFSDESVIFFMSQEFAGSLTGQFSKDSSKAPELFAVLERFANVHWTPGNAPGGVHIEVFF